MQAVKYYPGKLIIGIKKPGQLKYKPRFRIIKPPGKGGAQDQHPGVIVSNVIHACTITAGGLPYQQKSREIFSHFALDAKCEDVSVILA